MLLMLAALAAPINPADRHVSLSTVSGAMIAQECAEERGLQLDVCTSYILGVADALQLTRNTCRPNSNASTLQTLAIVRRHIKDNPEKWGWHPSALIRESLVKSFPCRSPTAR